MRKLFIQLSVVAAVLAIHCLYQAPAQAQDQVEVEAEMDAGDLAVAERERAVERERFEDTLKKERGEDETPDQDAVQIGEAQAAGGCSFSPGQTETRNTATYGLACGAGLIALIIRQRKKA